MVLESKGDYFRMTSPTLSFDEIEAIRGETRVRWGFPFPPYAIAETCLTQVSFLRSHIGQGRVPRRIAEVQRDVAMLVEVTLALTAALETPWGKSTVSHVRSQLDPTFIATCYVGGPPEPTAIEAVAHGAAQLLFRLYGTLLDVDVGERSPLDRTRFYERVRRPEAVASRRFRIETENWLALDPSADPLRIMSSRVIAEGITKRALKALSIWVSELSTDEDDREIRAELEMEWSLAGAPSAAVSARAGVPPTPAELQAMRAARERVLEAARQRSSEVPKFIGDSPAILKIWPMIEIASKNALPVLILGEPGTGKELVAEIIHLASARRGRYNTCNCAGISEETQEDDLFGHVKGAFTGADRNRDGLFRASENGTLFLDEVADMSPKVQAGILRALDPGKIRPKGADTEIPVHVRAIAATNKDLQKERAERRFRHDLWSRLCSSLTIEIPPLRQRLEDFGPLLEHFAKGRKPTDKWLAELKSKSWEDGNVRDLKHAVEGALDRADVWETPEQQERSERDRIVAALREKKTKRDAADALDISRPTLDAKIETYGIRDDEWKTSTPG